MYFYYNLNFEIYYKIHLQDSLLIINSLLINLLITSFNLSDIYFLLISFETSLINSRIFRTIPCPNCPEVL